MIDDLIKRLKQIEYKGGALNDFNPSWDKSNRTERQKVKDQLRSQKNISLITMPLAALFALIVIASAFFNGFNVSSLNWGQAGPIVAATLLLVFIAMYQRLRIERLEQKLFIFDLMESVIALREEESA